MVETAEDLSNLADTGLEVLDLHSDPEFNARHLHVRNPAKQMEGMRGLVRAFQAVVHSSLAAVRWARSAAPPGQARAFCTRCQYRQDSTRTLFSTWGKCRAESVR